jgi:uncharacterized RmlC-like cupin family protein
MAKPRPTVAHPEEGMPAPPMPDDERREQYQRQGRWASWIQNEAGDMSGWHHHAGNDTYVYVGRGSLTIDFGPGGAESIEARAGDFIVIPSETVHREMTGADADLEAFVIRVGGDPEHVNLDGPEA